MPPDISPNIWHDIWEIVKAAGILGTVVMGFAYIQERKDRMKERDKEDARHTATLDVLNSIKVFMEIIKDRFPRS